MDQYQKKFFEIKHRKCDKTEIWAYNNQTKKDYLVSEPINDTTKPF